jgi:hypothetical protein
MPFSSDAEVLLPRKEAAGVADAMIEAQKGITSSHALTRQRTW